ncbi:PIN domain-containing protein [Kibdelosporangium aridum]|uniref:PIN domain-containing protein n=1 Tax=Kibdelosporangium aridum TaxID=2030 RepID=UPI0035ED0C2B
MFLDTCVLLKPYLCDTLLSIAECGIYRPMWSADVLTELERNLRKRGANDAQVAHRLEQMTAHFPDAMVTGYDDLVDSMTNHPKDRHVLAAAVRGGAETLVTENLKDFPGDALEAYDIIAANQDDFLLDQLDLSPGVVLSALRRQVPISPRATRG